MENREFYIDKDGFQIHAKLDFPVIQKEKMPLVILVHGLTGHMEERHIIQMAKTATEAGYVCLRVEMYGHGKTDGKFCNHNVAQWVLDLAYVIDYARSLPFVSDIYLSGHSQGGLTVMLTAALKGDQIKGIMPLSPAIIIVDMCRKGFFFDKQFDPEHLPEEIHAWPDKYVTANYARIGRTLPIEEAIAGYHGPVLLVHGTDDESVPVEYSIEADKKYDHSKLVLIQDDTHCFDRHLDQAAEAVKQWLEEQNGIF